MVIVGNENRLRHESKKESMNMAYNYLDAVKNDVRDAIMNGDYLAPMDQPYDDFIRQIEDEFFVSDNITGNESGSYTFDSAKAREYVTENMWLVRFANDEWDYDDTVLGWFLTEDWEAIDVMIRSYLLNQAIHEVAEEIGMKYAHAEYNRELSEERADVDILIGDYRGAEIRAINGVYVATYDRDNVHVDATTYAGIIAAIDEVIA